MRSRTLSLVVNQSTSIVRFYTNEKMLTFLRYWVLFPYKKTMTCVRPGCIIPTSKWIERLIIVTLYLLLIFFLVDKSSLGGGFPCLLSVGSIAQPLIHDRTKSGIVSLLFSTNVQSWYRLVFNTAQMSCMFHVWYHSFLNRFRAVSIARYTYSKYLTLSTCVCCHYYTILDQMK